MKKLLIKLDIELFFIWHNSIYILYCVQDSIIEMYFLGVAKVWLSPEQTKVISFNGSRVRMRHIVSCDGRRLGWETGGIY